MDNKDKERSTGSKMLFGTFLSNGITLSVAGLIVLLVGISGQWEFVITDNFIIGPGATIGIGAVLMLIGVSLIGVHLAKKKN